MEVSIKIIRAKEPENLENILKFKLATVSATDTYQIQIVKACKEI